MFFFFCFFFVFLLISTLKLLCCCSVLAIRCLNNFYIFKCNDFSLAIMTFFFMIISSFLIIFEENFYRWIMAIQFLCNVAKQQFPNNACYIWPCTFGLWWVNKNLDWSSELDEAIRLYLKAKDNIMSFNF